jgi:hypothetical protein
MIKPKYKKLIGITTVIAIASLLSFSTISRAFADNVTNDVASSNGQSTVSKVAGSSFRSVNYWIIANGNGGFSGCDASDGTPVTVRINSQFASPSSLVFNSCGPASHI